MGGALAETDRDRVARSGLVPLSAEDSLRLLDAALAADAPPVLVPTRLDAAALSARPDGVPAMLRGLVRAPARRAAAAAVPEAASWQQRLAVLDPTDRPQTVLDAVCAEVAVVLGHFSAASVDPERPFQEVGFDSLTGLELRNRLSSVTGLRLPATLVFDYPSPAVLARHLLDELVPAGDEAVEAELYAAGATGADIAAMGVEDLVRMAMGWGGADAV